MLGAILYVMILFGITMSELKCAAEDINMLRALHALLIRDVGRAGLSLIFSSQKKAVLDRKFWPFKAL